MEVVMRPVEELVPYAANSRTHSDSQVAQIVASITEFGFTNPILLQPNGEIIAGHGRLMAAKVLALEEVPTIVLDHLTPEQIRAYVIADNQLALNASWDLDLLKSELLDIQLKDFNLDILGFDESMMKTIFPDRCFLYISHSVVEVAKFCRQILVLRGQHRSPQTISIQGRDHTDGKALIKKDLEQTMLEIVNAA